MADGWDQLLTQWENPPQELTNQLDKRITNKLNETHINLAIEPDAIFVMAGGLQDDGQVHDWVIDRLDLVYLIYQQTKAKIICTGGGTYHKPAITNKLGFIIHEATACAEYLVKRGITPKDIYKEWASYDTLASCFFSYLNFIEPLKLNNILVITSSFHMPRTKAIFNWILSITQNIIKIIYLETPNNMPISILETRQAREQASLINLQTRVFPNIKTLQELHKWIFEEHKAYCSISELSRIKDIGDQELKSY